MSAGRLMTYLRPGISRLMSSSSSGAANMNSSTAPDAKHETYDAKNQIVGSEEERKARFEEVFSQNLPELVWCGYCQDEPNKWNKLKELFIGSIKHQNQEPGTNFESRDDGTSLHDGTAQRHVTVDVRKIPFCIHSYKMETYKYTINVFSLITVKTIGNLTDQEKRDTIGLWRKIMKDSE